MARKIRYFDIYKHIWEFEKIHPEYGTYNGAYNACFEASCEFQELLLEKGMITEEGREKDWDVVCVPNVNGKKIPPNYKIHWVFRFRDILIDFTARQFGEEFSFPEIWMGEYNSQRKELGDAP